MFATIHSEFEICAVMSLRNKICFMAVAADEEGLGPEELIGMETVCVAISPVRNPNMLAGLDTASTYLDSVKNLCQT